MSWTPQSFDDGGGFFSWSPVQPGDHHAERQQADKASRAIPTIQKSLLTLNEQKTFVRAVERQQAFGSSRAIRVKADLFVPVPQRLKVKVVAHDPEQKITYPFATGFPTIESIPPDVFRVKAHDPNQKFFRDTDSRFYPQYPLGKIEIEARLDPTLFKRFSLIASAPSDVPLPTAAARFSLQEGARRYSLLDRTARI